MWENIGPDGGGPTDSPGSYEHGWSSGPAPVLTNELLGVKPASPGFDSFVAQPHLADLLWARGDLPTPKGNLHFEWSRTPNSMTAKIRTPVPGTITLPVTGYSVRLDGRAVAPQLRTTTVFVRPGSHSLVVKW
jgi:hypothetical protein